MVVSSVGANKNHRILRVSFIIETLVKTHFFGQGDQLSISPEMFSNHVTRLAQLGCFNFDTDFTTSKPLHLL